MEHKLMTEQEKVEIFRESIKQREAGNMEAYHALSKSLPLPAYIAKVFKEKIGAEYLIQSGWNLAEAEAEFGLNWLK
jgi:hypothetical protein